VEIVDVNNMPDGPEKKYCTVAGSIHKYQKNNDLFAE